MPGEIDPLTGKPKVDGQQQTTDPQFVSKEDYEALRTRLDAFEQNANQFNRHQQYQPPAPTGPTFADQMTAYDKQIEQIDKQIDALAEEGKPFSTLLRERDKLTRAQTRLEIKSQDIDPAMNNGMQVIDYLSGEVTKGKMPYYNLVQKDMEKHLASLDPSQRMNPQVREAAYKLAVGDNVDKIMQFKQEEINRQTAASAPPAPSGKTGRTAGATYGEGIPDPKDILGAESLAALDSKGTTVDQHYKKLGYAGYEDWWNKTGKEYFGDQGGN